ncbi:MAG: sulfatase-like hydrolase/transferase [Verrucomicrobiota bacterium]
MAALRADPPNVLFIMVDDLGYGHCAFNNETLTVDEFDPYFVQIVAERDHYSPEQALEFSKRAMPTLSRLGDEGIIFTRAYSPSSLCAAARLAVATGKELPQQGIYTNMDVEAKGLQPGTHLGQLFQEAGYGTAHIGKWHIAKRDDSMIRDALDRHGIEAEHDFWYIRANLPDVYDEIWRDGYYGSVRPEQNPLANGFDHYYGYNTWASQFYDSTLVWDGYEHAGRQPGYNTDVFTDKAIDFMRDRIDKKKPFYVQLHYHAVHDFLEPNAPDPYFKFFHSESYDLTNFYAHVYAIDRNVERIVDFLEKEKVLQNTIIVFTSDNGAMSGGPSVLPGNAPYAGHKGTWQQGGTRVPLLFYWPEGIAGERRLDQMVSTMDILPTCLQAAGIQLPDDIDAVSLLGILSSEDDSSVRDQMIWSGIHARRWGYLINTSFKNHYTELPFAPGGFAIIDGDYMLRFEGSVGPEVYHECPEGRGGIYSLYNLREDPGERNDLKDQMPELVDTLLAAYRAQSADFQAPIVWDQEKWLEIGGIGAESSAAAQ